MYVVTGATGNTGRVVANRLLEQGKKVRVISRSVEHLQPFVGRGAEPFVADLADQAALAKAFTGTEAVYALIPPNAASEDFRAEQRQVAEATAGALQQAGVKYAVTLSSVGADTSLRDCAARSGRPPRETTANTSTRGSAAARSAAPAPVLAPK